MFTHYNSPEFIFRSTGYRRWRRRAGFNETSFYLGGKAENDYGASDMFCRMSCQMKSRPISDHILLDAWEFVRSTYPLLDSRIISSGDRALPLNIEYTSIDYKSRAKNTLIISDTTSSWEDIRDDLCNGKRLITDECLSLLYVFRNANAKFEMVLILSHCISDGRAGVNVMRSLMNALANQSVRNGTSVETVATRLPPAMEGCLQAKVANVRERWRMAIVSIMNINAKRLLNGLSIPTWDHEARHPISRQLVCRFPIATTQSLQLACKKRGLTLGHLIYAASTSAFANLTATKELFVNIGTPMNARPYFQKKYRDNTEESVLALAFLDVVLPIVGIEGNSSADASKLWTLSKLAKLQVQSAIQNTHFMDYTYLRSEQRMKQNANFHASDEPGKTDAGSKPIAFISFGSSAVGNLDPALDKNRFTHEFELLDISMGVRVRRGESLMHSWTVNSQLCLSLVYDNNMTTKLMNSWVDETRRLMESVLQIESDRAKM